MLSGIIARSKNSLDPKKEFKDCLKIIKEESEKKNVSDTSGLNDDEFRNLFRR